MEPIHCCIKTSSYANYKYTKILMQVFLRVNYKGTLWDICTQRFSKSNKHLQTYKQHKNNKAASTLSRREGDGTLLKHTPILPIQQV